MPVAGTETPLATVARSGDNVVDKFDNVSVRAMCSEAAESRMESNLTSCPEEVLNTTQSSDRDISFCATDSHKPNTDDIPFLKSSGRHVSKILTHLRRYMLGEGLCGGSW